MGSGEGDSVSTQKQFDSLLTPAANLSMSHVNGYDLLDKWRSTGTRVSLANVGNYYKSRELRISVVRNQSSATAYF